MTRLRILLTAGAALATSVVAACGGSSAATDAAPSPAANTATSDLERLTANVNGRVASGQAPAIVAGVILPDGTTKVIGAGDRGDGTRPDAATPFEIGSVTKTFTALALAQMVRDGDVALTDPVSRHLPGWTLPTRRRAPLTLVDLATQHSGLPREATNLVPPSPRNPYADYNETDMKTYLARATRGRARYEYSNIGFGLLGVALAHRDGTSYAHLVEKRVLEPLQMTHTRVGPLSGRGRAVGHAAVGAVVPPLRMQALAPAGAATSTVDDMLRYARAVMDAPRGAVGPSLDVAIRPRAKADAGMRIGLAWHIVRAPGGEIVWHNGGTAGFRTFMGVNRSRGTAIVVWANINADVVDDLGLNYLDSAIPVRATPPVHHVDAGTLDRMAGTYDVGGKRAVVRRDGDRLIVDVTGQDTLPLRAVNDTTYAIDAVGGTITFTLGPSGPATGLVFEQGGQRVRGPRVG